ncbi:MAG: hypothetical protein AAF512_03180, partial [Pseudomonadota bacterium]
TTQLETSTDVLGNYAINNLGVFTQDGRYALQATFDGSPVLLNSDSQPQAVLVGAAPGYAVLVQGKVPNEEGLAAHNKTLNRVYRSLRERGFEASHIRYFNYDVNQDVNGDGQNDIHAIPSKAAIQDSLENWAPARINELPAPFYLVMVDHGSPSAFILDDETITPIELDSWMSALEGGLNTAAADQPRVLIMGYCYSGVFLPALSGPNRLLISSAAAQEESYKGPLEEDGIRSGEFFIEELFHRLNRGRNFKQAFEQATQRTELFTRRGGNSTNSVNPFNDAAIQHPLLDDNGDGRASNLLGTLGDGSLAEQLFLGAGTSFDSATNANADIQSVTPVTFLADNENSTLLFIVPNDANRVDPAWAEVRSPTTELSFEGRTEQVEIDLDRVLLTEFDGSRFQREYTNFMEPGRYELFHFVRDSDPNDRAISPVKRSIVYKNRPGNTPPSAVDLLSPTESNPPLSVVFLLNWSDSVDPDGEQVTYTLRIATDETMTSLVYEQSELARSMAGIDSSVGLIGEQRYYWQVIAVDAFGAHTNSMVKSFQPGATNPAFSPTAVNVNASDSLIPLIAADVSSGTPLEIDSFVSGNQHLLLLPSGEQTLTVMADGYMPATVEHTVPFGGTGSLNILLEPVAPAAPASFSFTDEILRLPVVDVPNTGLFDVQLQFNGEQFVLIAAEPLTVGSSPLANFSFNTGVLSIPAVAADDGAGGELRFSVRLLLTDPDTLSFELVELAPLL